jgi:hypothetical protein
MAFVLSGWPFGKLHCDARLGEASDGVTPQIRSLRQGSLEELPARSVVVEFRASPRVPSRCQSRSPILAAPASAGQTDPPYEAAAALEAALAPPSDVGNPLAQSNFARENEEVLIAN